MAHDSTERIVSTLRAWVESAPPGARLPSSRALMAEHGASPVTVQKAMHALAALGLIESRPGVGTFVKAAHRAGPVDYGWQTVVLGPPRARVPGLSATQRTAAPDAIGLHSGYPAPELLPTRLVRAAIARAARTDDAVLRAPATGLPALQAWFAAQLAETTPAGIAQPTARDVLILSGSQSGLTSIFRALVGAGRPLLIESPTYWGAIIAAEQAGVVLVPIATGPDGPDPEEVDRVVAQTGARAFYVQPTYANPTGAQWTEERSAAILEIARRRGVFLIEDDWAHDLAIDRDPRPLAARDDDGHVIHLRSLTKSVSPALRVAALVARGPARERILADRAAASMYVSPLLQSAALDVVTQPAWTAHLRALRPRLRERRDLLIHSLRQHAPSTTVDLTPVGGLNLWVRLAEGVDPDVVAQRCAARGVMVAAGSEWFPAEAAGSYLRLNFSGPDPQRFPEATRILGEELALLER